MVYFEGTEKPEELIGLAWVLEDGSRKFYTSLSDLYDDRDARVLFNRLTDAEEHHKKTLLDLYGKISGKEPGETFPGEFLPSGDVGDVMEGGMSVSEGIDWVKKYGLNSALDLSVSLEANSYDLYIKMLRRFEDKHAQHVFKTLVTEEKNHLEKLTELLEKRA